MKVYPVELFAQAGALLAPGITVDPHITAKNNVEVSTDGMARFMEEEGCDPSALERLRLLLLDKRFASANQGARAYGVFYQVMRPEGTVPAIILSLPAITDITEAQVDLPSYSYQEEASLSRNASSVLVHELIHFRQTYMNQIEAPHQEKKHRGLGRFSLALSLEPRTKEYKRLKDRLNKLKREEEALDHTASLFKSPSYLDTLIKIERIGTLDS